MINQTINQGDNPEIQHDDHEQILDNKTNDDNKNKVETQENAISDEQKEKIVQFTDNNKQYTLHHVEPSTFSVFDENNNSVGSFTTNNIIEMIISENTINNIMIEKYICRIIKEPIQFMIIAESPLLNNIYFLILFNRTLKKFEETSLQLHNDNLENVKIIKKFIYSIVEHTLNIFTTKSHELKHSDDIEIKNKIKNQCVGLTFRLTKYLNSSINDLQNQYDNIIVTLEILKTTENKFSSELQHILTL